ncbi:hypothetical protein CDAR_533431 [Caerostris darwini]|uniref:Uncharacterized protein n=1 Tax=Caerostris darwini TaxID=1538125 RepID=A0AAV4SAJ3_9ARAC|nr:hypothetical protein CDAR_533431 [Caerostris darwini]
MRTNSQPLPSPDSNSARKAPKRTNNPALLPLILIKTQLCRFNEQTQVLKTNNPDMCRTTETITASRNENLIYFHKCHRTNFEFIPQPKVFLRASIFLDRRFVPTRNICKFFQSAGSKTVAWYNK